MATHAGTAVSETEALDFHTADEHVHAGDSTMLGFWIYLMSDSLIFAVLFATFGVLGRNYAAGPGPADLFELPLIALNTAMLLLSSITYGLAMLEVERKRMGLTLFWLGVTGLFGFAFLLLEFQEFAHMIQQGAGPQRSGFLSAFFALVGCHGLHVSAGLLWLGTMMAQIWARGFTDAILRRLLCFNLFWHALDIVWIGVFTIVYLIGSGL